MRTKITIQFLGLLLGLCSIHLAYADVYPMPAPGDDVVGENFYVTSGSNDTLLTIGNRYGIGMHEMLEANPQLNMDENSAAQRMGSGRKVLVPKEFVLPPFHKGIVVNLPELRLYYFSDDGQYVYTYPVGLGRVEWRTPLVSSSIVQKEVDPSWRVPKSIKHYVYEETGKELPDVVPPGADNPLGKYAMRLSMGNYLIHGTNQPWTIGKFVSSGCIRMHNEDVEQLFQMVKLGTPVYIINYANKAGWHKGQLYLESQKPMDLNAPVSRLNPGSLETVLAGATHDKNVTVDWEKVEEVKAQSLGFPQPIGDSSHTALSFEDAQRWN